MTTTTTPTTTRERARLRRFLQISIDDYLGRYSRQDDEDLALKAVAEAIAWTCALDEHLQKTVSNYETARASDMDGKLLSGIRYARNRALHQFAEIVKMVRGAALPIALAAPLWEFEWRLVSELPPPDSIHNKKSQKAGEAVYKDKLAGNPARFALDAVARWFDRVVCVDAKATT